ncbi:MAG: thioesterase family protein [Desulfosarcinaceae bacterium]|nr:thioesterase family protein [Desulfosarcinaceae bacterium]
MTSTTDITIRNFHIDHFGHVNHARYVELLEEARWRYLEENGLLRPLHRRGALHVVVGLDISYRHAAVIGDVLRFTTSVSRCLTHRFTVEQSAVVTASGILALRATVTNVFVDRSGRPRPVDAALLDAWPDLKSAAARR